MPRNNEVYGSSYVEHHLNIKYIILYIILNYTCVWLEFSRKRLQE